MKLGRLCPRVLQGEHPVGPLLDPLRLRVRRSLARLPPPLAEFILFGLKQAWACLFAGLMLAPETGHGGSSRRKSSARGICCWSSASCW